MNNEIERIKALAHKHAMEDMAVKKVYSRNPLDDILAEDWDDEDYCFDADEDTLNVRL